MKFCKYIISLLIIVVPLVGWSAVIREVRVEGAQSVSTESILAAIGSRRGMSLDRDQVNRDIRTIYGMGTFMSVDAEEKVENGQTILLFQVKEKPVINAIRYDGNKKLKDKAFKELVTVMPNRTFDERALVESKQKILKKYKEKGYYLVNLTHSFEPAENGTQDLVFHIQENKKTFIREVVFEGNSSYSDSKLKGKIKTKKKGVFSFFTGSGKLKEEKLELDQTLLKFHYLNNGYLKVAVFPPVVDIDAEHNQIKLTYQVEEGDPYVVKSLSLEGDVLTTKEELLHKTTTRIGKRYNQTWVEGDVSRLNDRYGNMGYAYVNVRPIPKTNDDDKTADLVFRVTKGERINIETINITGNTSTRDKVIRRELMIKEGDVYSEEAMKKSKENLMRLGFFEEVNFSTPRGSADDSVILNIAVKEKPTGQFQIGAGFSSIEHFYFSASVVKQNFFGRGISGQVSAELSKLRQQYVLSITDPYFLDTDWIVGLSTYKTDYNYYDFSRQSLGGNLDLGRRIFDYSQINLTYTLEDVKVTDFSTVVPQIFRDNASGLTSGLGVALQRDTRDNRLFPTKGMYHSVQNEVSGTKLGGDNDFYRFTLNNRFYLPIKWGIVTKFQFLGGYVKSLGSRSVPLYERYFLGGPYSLRGFYPRSIGPRLQMPLAASGADTEFVYGGNKQLQFNFENEFPIYLPAGFKANAFFDAGQAFSEDQSISIKQLRANYGFGLKWVSPIGPLRFEWGIPIHKRPGESGVLFNFSIGDLF